MQAHRGPRGGPVSSPITMAHAPDAAPASHVVDPGFPPRAPAS